MLDCPGIALFLNFKKAFDSLEWSFVVKALEMFNFGAPLIQWINTFLQEYSKLRLILTNGYTTSN